MILERYLYPLEKISSESESMSFRFDLTYLGVLKPTYLFLLYVVCDATAAAKSLQLCPTLCDPIDGSPPGSPIPGILQARTLEWVAISFSNAGK